MCGYIIRRQGKTLFLSLIAFFFTKFEDNSLSFSVVFLEASSIVFNGARDRSSCCFMLDNSNAEQGECFYQIEFSPIYLGCLDSKICFNRVTPKFTRMPKEVELIWVIVYSLSLSLWVTCDHHRLRVF